MRKPANRERREYIRKLKPYWTRRNQLCSEFSKKERELEEEMNGELKTPAGLEFIYIDGNCVGIGAENYNDRKKFPLIHDSELEELN